MKDHCPKSCGLCTLVPSPIGTNPISVLETCKDKDKRCPAWAAYANQCQTNRLFMSQMCKETCGLCFKNADEYPHVLEFGNEQMNGITKVSGASLTKGWTLLNCIGLLVAFFVMK